MTLAGPLSELHLADELRLHEMYRGRLARRSLRERLLIGGERSER